MKQLSEMTLKELWELFPIFLVKHNEKWAKDYAEIEVLLKNIFSDCHITRISHIGSTAIKNIYAKNIIDILVETDDIEKAAKVAERNDFIRMSSSSQRVALNKGYTPEGFADKVYHLHIRHEGDNKELYFRDYLTEHAAVAKEYERMKLDLWKKYEHDRDTYTEAKTDFVEKWTSEAFKLYVGRY